MYTIGCHASDELKSKDDFKKIFKDLLTEKKIKYTDDEYTEFVFNGEDIIDEFTKPINRLKYFPSKKYEFIGVEFPLEVDIKNNTTFVAYLDLILKDKDTGVYKIYDIKTSSMGWNNYMKEDSSKTTQLVLYKAFYSKIFNVPLNMIEVEFFILKRKLYDGVSFPQSRIQRFVPDTSKSLITESINDFIEFVDTCFTAAGEYNTVSDYFKNPGKNKKNCKYCPHCKTEHCDGKEEK